MHVHVYTRCIGCEGFDRYTSDMRGHSVNSPGHTRLPYPHVTGRGVRQAGDSLGPEEDRPNTRPENALCSEWSGPVT